MALDKYECPHCKNETSRSYGGCIWCRQKLHNRVPPIEVVEKPKPPAPEKEYHAFCASCKSNKAYYHVSTEMGYATRCWDCLTEQQRRDINRANEVDL